MKRLTSLILSILVLGQTTALANLQKPQSISAASAIVMDAATGYVLFGKEEDTKRAMASTTKIMTTLLLLETLPLQQTIKVTEEMVAVEGTSMGLLPGDTVTVEGLCYGMMLCSGNDAANTAAIAVAGSLERFAEKMNQKAAALGMTNSHFVTPSGLDDDQHYSTTYDMALLTAYALQNPVFGKIAASSSARVSYGDPPYARTLTNHNRLLTSYEGCVGVKTGFTKKSGRCLVSAATRDGATLICVTLSAPDDWNDHKALLDYGFSGLTEICHQEGQFFLPVVGCDTTQAAVYYNQLVLSVPQALKESITFGFEAQHFLYAPVQKGATVGSLTAYYQDKPIAQTPIYIRHTMEATPYTPPFFIRFWGNFVELLC